MSVADLLTISGIFVIGQALAMIYLKASIEASIRHGYDQELETQRYELRQREQAAMIAELLAEWSAEAPDRKRLNQLAWEASLWLPADTVAELAKVLCRSPDARDLKELLVDVRRHIKGKDDGVEPWQIVHFNRPTLPPENT